MSRFHVPRQNVFLRLDEIIKQLALPYQPLGLAFRYNLESTLSVVSVPFQLASASAHHAHFQRFLIAERIRARSINEVPGHDMPLENFREAEALKTARRRIVEFAASPKGMEVFIDDTSHFLLSGHVSTELKPVAGQLIQQGVIATWSAIEILFRDVLETELNLFPAKAVLLSQDGSTKKRFELDRLSVEILATYNFDISKRLGTIVVGKQDFSDIATARSAYVLLFPKSIDFIKNINDSNLYLLNQRRHLLVHRRGIIDQKYLNKTSDSGEMGRMLELKPKDFEMHFDHVLKTGESLLYCLRECPESRGQFSS